MLLSYNVHGEVLNDKDNLRRSPKENLIKHLDQSKPKHILVLRHFDLAMELAKRYPFMTVHIRYWTNEGVINKNGSYAIEPKKWLDNVKKDWIIAKNQGVKNVSFYTTNEPRQLKEIGNWHKDLMELNLNPEYQIPLTVLNLGHYEPNEIILLKEVFRLCALRPDLFILGIHEYFTGLPSSGMPEVAPDGSFFFPVNYDKWDRRENATRFHVGRHQFILKFCDDNQINRPRIVVTEFGADRLDEGGNWVGKWLNSLILTQPYLNIRGWLSCYNQWINWFKDLFGTSENIYFHMLQYLAVRVYQSNYLGKPRNIEGALLFSWWNSGELGSAEDWTQFRVDVAPQLQNLISDFNNGIRLGLEDEIINPINFPELNNPRWYETKAKALDPAIIYSDRNTNSSIVGVLPVGTFDVKTIYEPLHYGSFAPIIWGNKSGYVLRSWVSFADKPTMPTKESLFWKEYKLTPKFSSINVYEWTNTHSRRLLKNVTGEIKVKHIPSNLLNPLQDAYLNEITGYKWLIFYSEDFLEPKIGYILESDVNLEPVIKFENPSVNDLRWLENAKEIRSKFDKTDIYDLPDGNAITFLTNEWTPVNVIVFDNMSDNEIEISKGNWILVKDIVNTIGWIKTDEIEFYIKPDNSEVLILIDSSLSELTNVRNNLITIKEKLKDK